MSFPFKDLESRHYIGISESNRLEATD